MQKKGISTERPAAPSKPRGRSRRKRSDVNQMEHREAKTTVKPPVTMNFVEEVTEKGYKTSDHTAQVSEAESRSVIHTFFDDGFRGKLPPAYSEY